MAANDFLRKEGKSVGLVVLFLLALLSPLLMNPVEGPVLEESDNLALSGPFTQASGTVTTWQVPSSMLTVWFRPPCGKNPCSMSGRQRC